MMNMFSILTRNQLALLAASGSFALLAGAFIFQFFGYPPCAMCLWQRWPHAAAILIGALFLSTKQTALLPLGAMAAVITSGLGLYHAGVEQKFWQGPTSCTSSGTDLGTLGAADLLPSSGADALVLCDAIVWDTWGLGLTMAGWNFLVSAVFALLWILAWRKAP